MIEGPTKSGRGGWGSDITCKDANTDDIISTLPNLVRWWYHHEPVLMLPACHWWKHERNAEYLACSTSLCSSISAPFHCRQQQHTEIICMSKMQFAVSIGIWADLSTTIYLWFRVQANNRTISRQKHVLVYYVGHIAKVYGFILHI